MIKNFSEAQKKAALVIVIAAIAVVIDVTFLLRPQMGRLIKVSTQLHQAKKSLKQYKNNYKHIKNLQLDVEGVKAKSGNIEKNLFSDTEIPFLLDGLSQKAISCGVKIMQIQPLEAQAQNEKAMGEVAGLRLYPIALKLALSAGYHQLGAFVSLVEENPLMMVQDLKIDARNAELRRQNVTLVLRAYVNKK